VLLTLSAEERADRLARLLELAQQRAGQPVVEGDGRHPIDPIQNGG
jgi:hypothetical protein